MSKWNYVGDVNVECGGYWWRQERPDDDYADIVEIIPDSDMGGADNVFHIHVGSVYLGWSESEKRKALVCSGYSDDISEATVDELVRAVQSYCGYDMHEMHTIRIGEIDRARSWVKNNERHSVRRRDISR